MNKEKLQKVLQEAEIAHSEYENVILSGEYDKEWISWYGSFVMGRLGEDILSSSKPSELHSLIQKGNEMYEKSTKDSAWNEFVGSYIADNI